MNIVNIHRLRSKFLFAGCG